MQIQPINKIKQFLRLPQDPSYDPEVRRHFRRNFITNGLDSSFWQLGESFVSVNTIIPVFASTLTDSAVLIGLVPALINAGWFIPQLLMATYVKNLPKKFPFARAMAIVERIPFLLLPIAAYLVQWISRTAAIWFFLIVVALRGFASGMVALPWQEVIARVIPSNVRSRFFGITRTFGRSLAVIGSAGAGLILAKLVYPNNYAVTFSIGAIFIWISFIFFNRTIEPDIETKSPSAIEANTTSKSGGISAFLTILKQDKNFTSYLISRAFFQLASMASGFLAVYGIERFSLADQQAAVFSGFIFASGVLGFFVWGMIGDRIGPRKILLISDILQAAVLIMALFSSSVEVLYLIFLVFGFAQSGYMIGELILGMELGTEANRPIYLGLARSVPGVVILIAPLIGGVIITLVGYRIMFLVALIFSMVGIWFLSRVKERKHQFL